MNNICYEWPIQDAEEGEKVVLTAETNGFAIWLVSADSLGLLGFHAGTVKSKDGPGFEAIRDAVRLGNMSVEEVRGIVVQKCEPLPGPQSDEPSPYGHGG